MTEQISNGLAETYLGDPDDRRVTVLRTAGKATLDKFVVPAEGETWSMSTAGVPIIDKRATNPQKVEQDFRQSQEALLEPLTDEEKVIALDGLYDLSGKLEGEYVKDGHATTPQEGVDMRSNRTAIMRVHQVLGGDTPVHVGDHNNVVKKEDMTTPKEILDGITANYTSLGIAEEDGTVHSKGYEGSILYQYGRASQLLNAMDGGGESSAKFRQAINTGNFDNLSHLLTEPVVVLGVGVDKSPAE